MTQAAATRSLSLLLLPFFASCACLCVGCDMPAFESKREVQRSEPAEGLRRLVCVSHNGGIEVRGSSTAKEVAIRAELSARGDTQKEADENCAQLDVVVERRGDELVVTGKSPVEADWQWQPSFAFVIEVPVAFAADLTTHNGVVRVTGTNGELRAKTHNGGVEVLVGTGEVAIESHNGRIVLTTTGEGAIGGSVVTHNGGIDLRLGARACTLEASTHNGSIRARGGRVVHSDDDHLTLEAGTGGGKLVATTHNGDVNVVAGSN